MTTNQNRGNPQEAVAEQALTEVARQVAQQSETLHLHITQHADLNTAKEQADHDVEQARSALEESLRRTLSESDQLEQFKEQAAAELRSQVENAVQTIEENYQTAMANARENLARLHEEHQQQLRQDYLEALNNALTTIQRERDQQRDEFKRLSEQAVADAKSTLETALEASRKEYQTSLADAVANLTRLHVEREQRLQQDYQKSLDNAFAINRQERDEQRAELENLCEKTVADLTANLERALEASANEHQDAMVKSAESLNAEQQRNNETIVASISTRWTRFSRILIGATVISAAIAITAIVVALL